VIKGKEITVYSSNKFTEFVSLFKGIRTEGEATPVDISMCIDQPRNDVEM